MQAIVIREYGDVDKLQYATDIPKPTLVDGNSILVKIHAAGLNPVDTKKRTGSKGPLPSDKPYVILGYDGAGVVEEIGSDVTRFKVGDEVYFAGDISKNGTNAQYTVVDSRIVGHRPKNLTWEQSAVIPLVALTAYEGLVENMGIPVVDRTSALPEPTKSILVIGGAGGVGGTVIQYARKLLNLKVIATASRPESAESCIQAGAHHIIDYSKDMQQQLKDLGYPNGEVDYIYNTISTEEYLPKCISIIKPLGHIVNIVGPNNPVNIGGFFGKRAIISFELMFCRPLNNAEPERQGKILDELSPLYNEGFLDHRLAKVFPYEQIKEAHVEQVSGKVIGKNAITIPL